MTGGWRRRLAVWSALVRDDHGVTAIEFAIAAPFILFMVLGTLELGFDMIMDARVEYAAQSASRYGLTTIAPATGTREDAAKSIVMTILGPWTRLPNTTVSVVENAYASYADVGTNNHAVGLGGLGDVVSYTISLTTPGVSGIPQLLGISMMTFQRNYIVQNEK